MTQDPLFEVPATHVKAPEFAVPKHRVWTESKAKIIAEYLRRFVLVTKHGTYIDGFAGRLAQEESWAAKLVLEIEPPWLRQFFLYDIDDQKVEGLRRLADQHRDRSVRVENADFNIEIGRLLDSGMIGPREAAFCLLDQKTFECHWSTVKRLASHPKAEYKIELFYFLANGWLDRALGGSRNDREQVSRWWGSDDWTFLRDLGAHERADRFRRRFTEELQYRSAVPWAIYEKQGSGRITYFMIHATDHERAPKLMEQAYYSVVPTIQDRPLFDISDL